MGRAAGAIGFAPSSLTWSVLNSSQLLRTKVLLSSDQCTEKANVCWEKGWGRLGEAGPEIPSFFLGAGRDPARSYLKPCCLH